MSANRAKYRLHWCHRFGLRWGWGTVRPCRGCGCIADGCGCVGGLLRIAFPQVTADAVLDGRVQGTPIFQFQVAAVVGIRVDDIIVARTIEQIELLGLQVLHVGDWLESIVAHAQNNYFHFEGLSQAGYLGSLRLSTKIRHSLKNYVIFVAQKLPKLGSVIGQVLIDCRSEVPDHEFIKQFHLIEQSLQFLLLFVSCFDGGQRAQVFLPHVQQLPLKNCIRVDNRIWLVVVKLHFGEGELEAGTGRQHQIPESKCSVEAIAIPSDDSMPREAVLNHGQAVVQILIRVRVHKVLEIAYRVYVPLHANLQLLTINLRRNAQIIMKIIIGH